MERRLLRTYDCCLKCSEVSNKSARRIGIRGIRITYDHIIAKLMGKDHPNVLGSLVSNNLNLAPFCWDDHRELDRYKFRAYRLNGVTGLVVYLGKDYPRSSQPELQLTENWQIGKLLFGVAANIQSLNGDTPQVYREDYERALERALSYAEINRVE